MMLPASILEYKERKASSYLQSPIMMNLHQQQLAGVQMRVGARITMDPTIKRLFVTCNFPSERDLSMAAPQSGHSSSLLNRNAKNGNTDANQRDLRVEMIPHDTLFRLRPQFVGTQGN
ncbi:hypothetical protein DKX38_012037 [Salix brachista]|uniref:Uncharacterized protein n=1 Tax=Salix brachista TaxID=2182728 RepID=A0A5N5LM98_9ROSI|nr:hypothetical protein DKX38_012037 [Salix brachista]